MLRAEVERIVESAGAQAIAVSFYDYETDSAFSLAGGRWFHAASTIKLAILVALYHAVAEGRLALDDTLHVRNRFASRQGAAPFRVARERDADPTVHAQVGRLMRVGELAERMIVASSNLATNLLVDLLGAREAAATLDALGVTGIELLRGVEDEAAHQAGIDNRVTADGLLGLLRLCQEQRAVGGELGGELIAVLLRQQLGGGIQLGLPEAVRKKARVAHKTGEISTVAHDAGLVFLPDRRPYALVLLSEWPPGTESRQPTLGRVAAAVHRQLIEGRPPEVEG